MQCSRKPAELDNSRFTKCFSIFSTDFVDNFVENDPTNSTMHTDGVYLMQSIASPPMLLNHKNQPLGKPFQMHSGSLPNVLAAQKIVHKSGLPQPHVPWRRARLTAWTVSTITATDSGGVNWEMP